MTILMQSEWHGLFAAVTGMAALVTGSLFLLLDLEHPLAAVYAIGNLRSWITWGVVFILLYMALGFLYALPYVKTAVTRWQRAAGLGAGAFGLLVAVYTGFLLSGSTGIPAWNTPALPLLFVVSGTSTGAALLMIYLALIRESRFTHGLLHALGKIDIGLIAFELLVLFAFLNMGWYGTEAVEGSARAMFGAEMVEAGAAAGPAPDAAALARAVAEAQAVPLAELQGAYTAAFVQGYPTTPCRLLESVQREGQLIGESTEEAAMWYSRFGLAAQAEQADHLTCELEFLAYLTGTPVASTEAERYRRARIKFAGERLAPWGRDLADRIPAAAPAALYRQAGALLGWLLAAEAALRV